MELSEFERGYLTGFYNTFIFSRLTNKDYDPETWFTEIGKRRFALKLWFDTKNNFVACKVFECGYVNDTRFTDYSEGWMLTDQDIAARCSSFGSVEEDEYGDDS